MCLCLSFFVRTRHKFEVTRTHPNHHTTLGASQTKPLKQNQTTWREKSTFGMHHHNHCQVTRQHNAATPSIDIFSRQRDGLNTVKVDLEIKLPAALACHVSPTCRTLSASRNCTPGAIPSSKLCRLTCTGKTPTRPAILAVGP